MVAQRLLGDGIVAMLFWGERWLCDLRGLAMLKGFGSHSRKGNMDWYYSKQGSQQGPVSGADLQAKVMAGEVLPSDLAWREGMADWQPVSTLGGLLGASEGGGQVPLPEPMYGGQKQTSGLAIASLVCSLVGILCMILPGILGVVFGHMALAEIRRSEGQKEGRGMAIAGLVIGYLCVLIIVVYVAIFVVALAAGVAGL